MRNSVVRHAVLALAAVVFAACGSSVPPSITSITPTSGVSSGGTVVTITGVGLEQATGVVFKFTSDEAQGAEASATAVHSLGSKSVVCTTPADPNAGIDPLDGDPTDVTVYSAGGSATLQMGFTYYPQPSLTVGSVMPTSGPTSGGTAVTISGANFPQEGVTVQFGSALASGVTVNSSTSVSATTPNGNAGTVDVTVTNPANGQSAVLSGGFTYNGFLPAPTLSSVTPSSGSTDGGFIVTLSGDNFQSGATVQFLEFERPVAQGLVAKVLYNTILVAAPAESAGLADVTVTNPDGQSATLSDGFRYFIPGSPVPTISSVMPTSGPTSGGTAVTITGNFTPSGPAVVQFGSAQATGVSLNGSVWVVTTPAGDAGTVDVTLTAADGQSAVVIGGFTYVAAPPPTLKSVMPTSGPVGGGTAVTLSGDNFQTGATVQFGSAEATAVIFNSLLGLSATTPAGTVGAVDVKVTNPDGQSAVLSGGYLYNSSSPVTPTLTSVSPPAGTSGTNVVLSGTNFQAGATVSFGGAPVNSALVTVNSPTSISTQAPAGVLGTVDVAVTDPDGQEAVLVGGFTYTLPAPTLTSVTPTSGPVTGGTVIALAGTNFQNGAFVQIGSLEATAVTFNNSLSLSATTDRGTAGPADVKVTNPDGQYAVLTGGFIYLQATAIAAGSSHTCAIVNGGAQCWGWNVYGQLGDDNTAPYIYVPVQVQGLTSGVTAIVGGYGHSCALVNGGVQCWGDNQYGQLGNNSATDSNVPVPVSNLTSGVQAIAAGGFHTCAIDVNGAAWCWGDNQAGDLGNNSTTESKVPVQVQGLTSGVKAIAAGEYHSCAVDMNGAAWCWGDNQYGELGNKSTTYSAVPVQVQGLTSGVQVIAAGGAEAQHTCAIPADNSVMCWGNNSSGELGNNSTTNSNVPVAVTGLPGPAQAVAGGFLHTCAVVNGGVWCWGDNFSGDLGNNSTTESNVPVQVIGLLGAQDIAEGAYHSCAVVSGTAWCWGLNEFGQLGNNSQGESHVPVEVYGL